MIVLTVVGDVVPLSFEPWLMSTTELVATLAFVWKKTLGLDHALASYKYLPSAMDAVAFELLLFERR